MNSKPIFILVEPQMGENIGGVTRAMANFGLDELRIVNPRDGWPNEKAIAMSAGAIDIMKPIMIHQTLADAIADCHYIYTTAAFDRDMAKPQMNATNAAIDIYERVNEDQKIAIVFGRERSGLTNEEIATGQVLITIPVDPNFASLNLAQAALIMAYEYARLTIDQPDTRTPMGKSFPASMNDFDEFFSRLESELDTGEFFRVPEMRDLMKRNIRNAFLRAEFSNQEVKTLHGVLTALTRNRK
jgi:tRNA/rRNA methyltransferase